MVKYLPTATLIIVVVLSLLSVVEFAMAKDNLWKMIEKGMVMCLPSVTRASQTPPSDKCCAMYSRADLSCLCKYKDSLVLSQVDVKPELTK